MLSYLQSTIIIFRFDDGIETAGMEISMKQMACFTFNY